jgi:hypothetical protein
MDTRFWGPSGWKLLHLITFDYKPSDTNAVSYAQFFESLPYILPCKFCRASLTDYYRQYPFLEKGSLKSDLDLKRWMYNIHNCVNDKLRKQGLNPNKDPKYTEVKEFYDKWINCGWQEQLSTFWDFLFAVAYNHPKESTSNSKPMPECPKEVYKCKDTCEKNKWNVLSIRKKLYWFKRFWAFLPAVLPVEIAKRWEQVENSNPPTLGCRRSTLAWLWRMRCGLDSQFKDPYTSICKKIASYSSDCGKKKRAITCRKRRGTTNNRKCKVLRKTIKNRK